LAIENFLAFSSIYWPFKTTPLYFGNQGAFKVSQMRDFQSTGESFKKCNNLIQKSLKKTAQGHLKWYQNELIDEKKVEQKIS